jgi:hypothetical protein
LYQTEKLKRNGNRKIDKRVKIEERFNSGRFGRKNRG